MSLRKLLLFSSLSLVTFSLGLTLTVLFSPNYSFQDVVPNLSRLSLNLERFERRGHRSWHRSMQLDRELAAMLQKAHETAALRTPEEDLKLLEAMRQRVEQLEASGQAVLGISMNDSAEGVGVATVVDHSAAAQAGLAAGDLLTSFNDRLITSGSDLRQALLMLAPGVPVSITFERAGLRHEATVTLQARPVARLPLTHRALGYAYTRAGRRHEAISQFEEYLREARHPRDRHEIRRLLNELR